MSTEIPLYTLRADQVKEGMRLDLENDKYADPKGENTAFQAEYVTVVEVEIETEDTVRIDFDSADSVGFPLAHTLFALTD